MKELNYLLITDGSSDRALTFILNWAFHHHLPGYAVNAQWSDPGQLPGRPERSGDRLRWLIAQGMSLYSQADILFIHRDAENQPREQRITEIEDALEETNLASPPPVCVIPVRMIEAWLLIDEDAIRYAADNPNGKVGLSLPRLSRIEAISDPKEMLYDLLRTASELRGRRRKKFRPHARVHRLAELIDDYSPLQSLPAFQCLEADLAHLIEEQGWSG